MQEQVLLILIEDFVGLSPVSVMYHRYHENGQHIVVLSTEKHLLKFVGIGDKNFLDQLRLGLITNLSLTVTATNKR